MKTTKTYQIAIDGKAGTGKSSIAKLVAKKLNFLFLNTGGMFRCCALALFKQNLKDEKNIKNILNKINITLKGNKLFLNNVDVTKKANSSEISLLASKIATLKIVRNFCLIKQQEISNKQSVVAEGRDTTSVVLPNATLKIFLTANINIRAKRRWIQSGKITTLAEVKKDLINRDYQDMHRKIAPLKRTKDSIKISNDNLTVEENANLIIKYFKEVVKNV